MKTKSKSKRVAKMKDLSRFPLTNAELRELAGYLEKENEGKPEYDMDVFMASGGKRLVPIKSRPRNR
jgi:hypothetical protein